jgi:hypothetical protein
MAISSIAGPRDELGCQGANSPSARAQPSPAGGSPRVPGESCDRSGDGLLLSGYHDRGFAPASCSLPHPVLQQWRPGAPMTPVRSCWQLCSAVGRPRASACLQYLKSRFQVPAASGLPPSLSPRAAQALPRRWRRACHLTPGPEPRRLVRVQSWPCGQAQGQPAGRQEAAAPGCWPLAA